MEPVPLSFDEIRDWEQFQELVAAYFRTCQADRTLNVTEVKANVTGKGPDGGCDIEVTLRMMDGLDGFSRKWVVQCKFYTGTVGLSDISSVSIPTLMHSLGADGYLLVCKESVSSKITDQFKALNDACPFKRSYCCWTGDQFLERIKFKPDLIKNYFPRHHQFSLEQEARIKNITNP